MLTVNEYFDGKVKSIGFQGETLAESVGVMVPGDYQFDTSKHETMTVISGELIIQLPGQDTWQAFPAGSSFEVEANQVFQVRVKVNTAYLCVYA